MKSGPAVPCTTQRSAQLGDRPAALLALQQADADRHLARDLDAGEAHLAVAHRGVHVADREHPARLAHRQVDGRAGAVQVVVEVAAVLAGEAVEDRRRSVATPITPTIGRSGKEMRSFMWIGVAVDPEDLGQRRLDLVDQLPDARDQRREAAASGRTCSSSTTSESPGSAPRTAIGPVAELTREKSISVTRSASLGSGR